MRDASPGWKVVRFTAPFDEWADREQIAPNGRLLVMEWIHSRGFDPYQDVERELNQDNLWYGRIPGSEEAIGHTVTGSYYIFESTRVVRGNSLMSWPPPF